MNKILHTSDWHLDGGLKFGHINPKTGMNTRMEDKVKIINEMIDYAIDHDIKVIVHAGDITNNTTPSTTTEAILCELVQRIVDNGIHFIECDGNHTMPKNPTKKSVGEILKYVSRTHVHVSTRSELIEVEGVQFAMLPWVFQSRAEANERFADLSKEEARGIVGTLAAEQMQSMIAQADSAKPLVCVAHAMVTGSVFGSERDVMMGQDVELPYTAFLDEKVSYAALGHIHKAQAVGEEFIRYSGTPERVSFGEKDEEKGFVVVTPEVGKRAEWEFVKTDARDFREINISTGDNLEMAMQEILTDKIAKVKVTGTKSELQTFDFSKLQNIIEDYTPHYYEIVKVVEKDDREKEEVHSSNLEELSPVQILEKFAEKKKLKKGETKRMLEEARNILADTEENSISSGSGGFLPLSLHLKNFCSHSDTLLDVSDIEKAVLSGENGAGKSSLIDSLFWAVWGVSRTKSDDDLIRNGYGEMSVEFKFLLGNDEYRIVRTRTKKGKTGKGSLDLFSGKTPLSENSIKTTQEKIISLLGMTSEIFSSSAYLRQGEGNLFTSTTPSKRKEILAELLNLSIWGEIEGKTKEKRKEYAGKTERFLARKELIEEELKQEKSKKEEQKNLENELSNKTEQLKIVQEELSVLESGVKDFTTIQTKKTVYENAMKRAEENILRLENELAQQENSAEVNKKIILGSDKIKRAAEEIKTLEIQKQEAERKRNSFLEKKSEIETLKAQKSIKEAELNTLISVNLAEERDEKIEELQSKCHSELQKNTEKGKALFSRMKNAGTDCPSCGANKNHQHRNPRQELEDELEVMKKEYVSIKQSTEKEVNKIRDIYSSKIATQSEKIETLRKEVSLIIIPELKEVSSESLQEISKRIQELKPTADLLPRLEVAQQRLDDSSDRINSIKMEKMKSEKEVENNKLKIESLPKMDESALLKIEEQKRVVDSAKSAVSQQEGRIAVVKNMLMTLKHKREDLNKEEEENKEVLEIVSALDSLAEASGKNGAVAMVIDSVIPEIEKEANEVLKKISDGKMKVRFSTTREKKSASKKEKEIGGAMSETLDVWVEDDAGEKEYDSYSGGERFRVDFAIRIALSKILARRAGTQIRFLMIDEAGTALDEAGKTAFIQSLDRVSQDFEKILFITHLEDLKDVFETKIFVEKENGESRISIF